MGSPWPYAPWVKWTVHGERRVYESPWVNLSLVDVEVPGQGRFEHHVVRMPQQAAGVVVHRADLGVLVLWRHRFITDTWGWEIPAGRVEPGEAIEDAARREVLEETGWRLTGGLAPLIRFHPMNGVSDQVFNIFHATEAEHVGEPTDASESERVEWVAVRDLKEAAREGRVGDGLSLGALTYAFAFGPLDQ